MAYEKCIAGLMRAAGRELSDEEVSAIFERLHKAARDIKAGRMEVTDVELPSTKNFKEPAEGNTLIQMAAEQAAKKLIHEAEVQRTQAALQVNKLNARKADIQKLGQSKVKHLEAIKGLLFRDYSGRYDLESLEQHFAGVRDTLKAKLMDTWESLGNDFLGFFQDRTKLINLIKELRGEDSGDALAKKGAKTYHDVAEQARQWFNSVGGDVGKLDDWGFPQHHSQERVAAAGREQWLSSLPEKERLKAIATGATPPPDIARKYYVESMLPVLKKTQAQGKYYHDDLGIPWPEAQLRTFIEKAWDNISTNGHSSTQPGQFKGSSGKVANRHAESRQIHFPDAESVIKYWEEFGEKSAVEILSGHIESMAKDIAMVDYLGPNPQMTYQTLRDEALKEAAKESPSKTPSLEGQAHKLDDAFNYISGRTKPSVNPTFSKIADGISHLNVAGKLGGSMLASLFGDKPMYEAISHLNNIPVIKRWQTELSLLNPSNAEDRHALMREGLMADAVRSGLQRFYEGFGQSSTPGKLANAVMRVTGMNAINEFRKAAFGAGMFSSIGNELSAGKSFADLAESDVRALHSFGVTEGDWKIWKLAKLDSLNIGSTEVPNALTPSAINRISDADLKAAGFDNPEVARRDATVKLLGVVNTESDFAIVTPGWKERAQFYSDIQRGTIKGEIMRSWFQFKSFPWTAFQRGMDLVANAETPVGKATMAAYLITSTTLAGAMLQQTRDVLSGKDPRAMFDKDWYKFWTSAFISGGALGIYGDFIYSINQNRYGGGILPTIAGPTFGPLLEMGILQPLDAIVNSIEGKPNHLLAQEAQNAKGFIPGGNIWYLKTAMDHLIWQQVFEQLSPGYLRTIRDRVRKDYGQKWWWNPGETTPDRAPDMSAAISR